MFKRQLNATDLQAAEWVVRLEDRERPLSGRDQGEFFAWLMRSAEHVKAFLSIADLSHVLEGIDRERRIDIEQLFLSGRSPTVPLRPSRAATVAHDSSTQLPFRCKRVSLALAASALLTLGGFATWRAWTDTGLYRTATGEQRTVQLTDGTVVNLNTHSKFTVHFTDRTRQVDLIEGEALFGVAHDASRPFFVRTRDAVIRAVGTQFNVYEHGGETSVAVIEGVVQVVPAEKPTAARLLRAGEQARVARGSDIQRDKRDVRNAVAWRERRLVFEDASLGDVISQFNRYNMLQLRADESLAANKHLTGVFSADQPQSLLHYLEQDPRVAVVREGDEVTIRAK